MGSARSLGQCSSILGDPVCGFDRADNAQGDCLREVFWSCSGVLGGMLPSRLFFPSLPGFI